THCTNSAHPYQNKGFINQNNEFLSPLFSHTCAHLRPQPLCFDMLHKNTRGEGGTLSLTVPSRFRRGSGWRHEEAEGSLALLGMTARRKGGARGSKQMIVRTWGAGVLRPYEDGGGAARLRRRPLQGRRAVTVIAARATPRLQSFVCHTPERLLRSVMHEIRVHNTLSGKVEPFVPLKPGEIRMYTCGPTVYDYAHIGNFRTFVFQDILRRFLKLRGFKLTHVMNLTD